MFSQNTNSGKMCYMQLRWTMQLLLPVCYGWFFNSTYISKKILGLAVLAKSEDLRVFNHTVTLLTSEFLFWRNSVILSYICTLILKIISIFSCLQQKLIPFALYETNYMCCQQKQSAVVSKDKHWSRLTLDILFIEKEKNWFSGTA